MRAFTPDTTKFLFFTLIGIGVALEVIGDVYFKKWAMENKTLLLILGLAVYFAGSVFWALSLKHEYLSKAGAIFTVLNLIAVVLIGALLFQENLTLTNKIGIALGIVSIILIEL
jgi:multidrug transporter EmrE-like cation transporter